MRCGTRRRVAVAALGSLLIYLLSPTLLLAADASGPRVTIASPKPESAVSGTVRVQVEVESEAELKYVVFFINDVLKGMTNIQPYVYRWITTHYPNGPYKIVARAYDAADNEGASPIVEVYVNNPVGPTQLLTQTPEVAAAPAPLPAAEHLRLSAASASLSPRLISAGVPLPSVGRPEPALIARPGVGFSPVTASGDSSAPAARIALLPRGDQASSDRSDPASAASGAPADRPAFASLPRQEQHQAGVAADTPALPSLPPVALSRALPVAASSPASPSLVGLSASPALAASAEARPGGGVQVAMLPALRQAPAPAAREVAPEPQVNAYTVQAGDCLWSIARRFDTRISLIVNANQLDEEKPLQVGQKLLIPASAAFGEPAAPPTRPLLYAEGKVLATDVAPFIAQGISMAPFRSVVEHWGGTVGWNPAAREATAKAGPGEIKVRIGDRAAQVNEKTVLLSRVPELRDDRTLVPLRFLASALNLSLRFEAESRTIHIAAR